jgi:hypothetical protein
VPVGQQGHRDEPRLFGLADDDAAYLAGERAAELGGTKGGCDGIECDGEASGDRCIRSTVLHRPVERQAAAHARRPRKDGVTPERSGAARLRSGGEKSSPAKAQAAGAPTKSGRIVAPTTGAAFRFGEGGYVTAPRRSASATRLRPACLAR